MEELSPDILVIGSGLAGMLSALEAERLGHRVILTGKFAIGMGTKYGHGKRCLHCCQFNVFQGRAPASHAQFREGLKSSPLGKNAD